LKLGLPPRTAGSDTRILVLDVPFEHRLLSLGLIADRVFEVTALDTGGVAPPPDIGRAWHSDYILGIGRRGDSFVVIFDLSRLLSGEDAALLGTAAHDHDTTTLTEV
jgi:purine-binding chemotaxis protein CheW